MTEPAFEDAKAPRLQRLTALRAFAALAVFFFHAFGTFGSSLGSRAFGLGYTGVAFFFVLSGFVLTWSTTPTLARSAFYRRRFARIWPLHFVTGIIAGCVYTFGSVTGTVSNWFLVQAWFPEDKIHYSLNGASWSLSDEAFFYALWPFAIVLALRAWRRFATVAVLAFLLGGAVTALSIAHGSRTPDVIYVFPLARVGEFLIGIALAVALRRGKGPRVPVPVALGVLLVLWEITRVWFAEYFPFPDYLLTPGFVLLIWAAATADVQQRASILHSRPLVYAGEVSFAFYLVHQDVIRKLGEVGTPGPAAVQVATAFAVAAALAVAGHELIEKPFEKRLRGRRQTPEPVALRL